MRRTPCIPTQLKHILEKEGRSRNMKACIENIDKAKENELHAYLSLCHARLDLPLDST